MLNLDFLKYFKSSCQRLIKAFNRVFYVIRFYGLLLNWWFNFSRNLWRIEIIKLSKYIFFTVSQKWLTSPFDFSSAVLWPKSDWLKFSINGSISSEAFENNKMINVIEYFFLLNQKLLTPPFDFSSAVLWPEPGWLEFSSEGSISSETFEKGFNFFKNH